MFNRRPTGLFILVHPCQRASHCHLPLHLKLPNSVEMLFMPRVSLPDLLCLRLGLDLSCPPLSDLLGVKLRMQKAQHSSA